MASRARAHFEAALGVLLVARSGQDACAELATIMAGWDGKLTVLLRKRVSRHIRRLRHLRCAAAPRAHPGQPARRAAGGRAADRAAAPGAQPGERSLAGRGGPAAGHRPAARAGRARAGSPGRSGRPARSGWPASTCRAGTAAGGAIIVGGALLAGGAILHHHAGQGAGGAPGARPEPSVTEPAQAAGGGPGGESAPSGGAAALAGGGQPASSHAGRHQPGRSGTAASGTPSGGATASAAGSASGRGRRDRNAVRVPAPAGSRPVGGRLVHRDADADRRRRRGQRLPHHRAGGPAARIITLSRTSGSLAAGQSVHITVTAAAAGCSPPRSWMSTQAA